MGFLGFSLKKSYKNKEYVNAKNYDLSGNLKIDISDYSPMNLSAVFSAVDKISNTIATLPINLYKVVENDDVRTNELPIQFLLHSKPNNYQSIFDFKKLITFNLLSKGNAFIYIEKDNSYIKALHIKELDVYFNEELQDKLFYSRKEDKYYFSDEIIHILNFTENGITGISTFNYALKAINRGSYTDEFASKYFENGTNIAGILSNKGANINTIEGIEAYKSEINKELKGVSNSHKLAVMIGEYQYLKMNDNSENSQLLDSRKYTKEEIAGFFNIPLPLMNNELPSNTEVLNTQYLNYCIYPIVRKIEDVFNVKLFFNDKYKVKFNMNTLLRADINTRTTHYKEMYNIGVYSQNDIRKFEDLPSIKGGDNHYIMSNNMTKID